MYPCARMEPKGPLDLGRGLGQWCHALLDAIEWEFWVQGSGKYTIVVHLKWACTVSTGLANPSLVKKTPP